jgi:hypothetical protein
MLHFCSVVVAAARVSLGNHNRIFNDLRMADQKVMNRSTIFLLGCVAAVLG